MSNSNKRFQSSSSVSELLRLRERKRFLKENEIDSNVLDQIEKNKDSGNHKDENNDQEEGDELLRGFYKRENNGASSSTRNNKSGNSVVVVEGEEEYQDDDEEEMLRLQMQSRSNVPLTAFNMKEEEKAGSIGKDGDFIYKRRDIADERDAQDAWLDTLKTNDDSYALTKEKVEKRKQQQMKKRSHDETTVNPNQFQMNLERLCQLVGNEEKKNETVLDALKRFGKEKEKEKLDIITDLAQNLLDKLPTIYEHTKRMLQAELEPFRKEIMEKTFWEYKLSHDTTNTIHGPFSSTMMQAWKEMGYFEANKETMMVRETKATPQNTGEPDKKKRKVTISAKTTTQELEDDFDDDDEEDQKMDQEENESTPASWKLCSQVDFIPSFL